jgi:hypothetical protein
MKGFVVNGARYTRKPAKLRGDHTGEKNVIMADTLATPGSPRRLQILRRMLTPRRAIFGASEPSPSGTQTPQTPLSPAPSPGGTQTTLSPPPFVGTLTNPFRVNPSPESTQNQTELGPEQSIQETLLQATQEMEMLEEWIVKLQTEAQHLTNLNESLEAIILASHGVRIEQGEQISKQGEEILKLFLKLEEQLETLQLQRNEIIRLGRKIEDLEGKDKELKKLQKEVELERQTKVEQRHNEQSDAGRFEL